MANEVLHYVKAYAGFFFEENHVACKFCPLLETYSRDQCRRTMMQSSATVAVR